ncbi:MBL fold metallo-hydrolase [Candidatus Saccharibacteria bacterium]|nr:MBL fold metallo-hydrolase [Candidatus Saccharibacteria bacterium]
MELQFFGANCIRLSTKKARIVIDDNLGELGLKSITKPDDIVLKTNKRLPSHPSRFDADMPGEYEIAGAIIKGVGARAHMDGEKETTSVIYTVAADDIKVAIVGHIYPELTEEQLEQIGLVDVAIVPVGGNGYTLDAVGALKIIKQIEPKIIIPTHYADKEVNYQVPQQELSEALKILGMEPAETVAKYKPNPGALTDATHLVVLERQ